MHTGRSLLAVPGEGSFSDGGDGSGNDHFLEVLAVTEGLMVNARDTGRQFDTHDGLVALKRTGSDEPCAFGNDKTRFDGFVSGNEDGVNPQASVGPVLFVEHNPGTVKSGAIDALYRFRKDDRREVLAALEGFVPNRDDGIGVLSDQIVSGMKISPVARGLSPTSAVR